MTAQNGWELRKNNEIIKKRQEMISYREDLEVEDLAHMTSGIHKLNPDLKEYVIVAVENAQAYDQNLTFLMEKVDGKDEKTVMISFEYVLEVFGDAGNTVIPAS
jgi:hypothetical protein